MDPSTEAIVDKPGSGTLDAADRVTYLGHSTLLVEQGGARILTDPILTRRVTFIRRVGRHLADDALDPSVVLISHAHLDHLHRSSMRRVARGVPVIVPRGLGRLVTSWGAQDVLEVSAGDTVTLGTIRLTATRAVHSGFRPPTGPRAEAIGYLMEGGGRRTYFAGDTDLFPEMSDLADPTTDLALLPVWGWGPNLGPGHLTPQRAAEAVALIRPRVVIPIHWGTLWPIAMHWRRHMLVEPPLVFARDVDALELPTRVVILPPGLDFLMPASRGTEV